MFNGEEMMIDIINRNHKIKKKNIIKELEKDLSEITDEEIDNEDDQLSIKIDDEMNNIIS